MEDGSAPEVTPIKVLVVDDHGMFREALSHLLGQQPTLEVVAQCSTSAEALELLQTSGATLILLDIELGAERALNFLPVARKRGFKGKVLVLTAGVTGAEAVQLVQSGVAGILHKHHSTDELRDAIQEVAGGGAYLEEEYLPYLFRSVDRTRTSNRPPLTDREKEILRFIFQGLTNKEIGERLEVSEGAVKAALRLLFGKLNVRTRAQLVKTALERYRDQL